MRGTRSAAGDPSNSRAKLMYFECLDNKTTTLLARVRNFSSSNDGRKYTCFFVPYARSVED